MYIDAHSQLPHHVERCRNVEAVMLDGVKMEFVVRLDTEEGYIEAYETDADGRLVQTNGGIDVNIVKVHGKVEIVWKEGYKP